MSAGWIGVDLDGTLARYVTWNGPASIGVPIPEMCERVRRWIRAGYDVRIFTARAYGPDAHVAIPAIQAWCEKHLGQRLPVTATKDYACVRIYDDRAVTVECNTGRITPPEWANSDRLESERLDAAIAKAKGDEK